jgi:aminoglycoside phosphotransferase (APT) family kinase protein
MPGLEQVEKAQSAIERNPLAFVAAFFALAFFALLALYLRARDRHLSDLHALREQHALQLAAIHDARLAEAVKVQTALHSFLAYVDKVQSAQRRRPKPQPKRRVSPEDATVRIAALPTGPPPREDGDAD